MRSVDYHDLLAREWPQDIIIGVPGAGNEEDSLLCRGDRMVLAGEQKSGKSVLLAQMIRGLVLGTDFLGFPVRGSRKVLYIQAELREARLKKRYKPWEDWAARAQVSMPRSQFFVWSTNGPLYLTGYKDRERGEGYHGLDLIYPEIEEIKPDVVVFDPLTSFHDSNENSSLEMKEFMNEIDKLKERVNSDIGGIAVVIAHHFRKRNPLDKGAGIPLVDQVRGSSALAGWADSLLCIGQREERDHKYLEFVLRDTDTQPQRELTYNYETKSFDWKDPREELAVWAREYLAAIPGGRSSSFEFHDAMHKMLPHLCKGRNWLTAATNNKRVLVAQGVLVEQVEGHTIWVQAA